ncbi:MAG: hypothetical protein ABUS79_03905 [Pseudomonadota bacterium]
MGEATVAAAGGLDDEGEAMWRELAASWAEQTRHDRFVQHCFSTGRLAAAGARYRLYGHQHPGDETARRMQERVVFLSLQALAMSSSRRAGSPFFRSPWFLGIVLLGAAVGAALGFVYGGRP